MHVAMPPHIRAVVDRIALTSYLSGGEARVVEINKYRVTHNIALRNCKEAAATIALMKFKIE